MAKLTLAPKPLKVSISEVVAQAVEQKAASEDYLGPLRSEPVVLNYAVSMTNCSRPELIPDHQGRIIPMMGDKYLSVAFLEVMCTAVKAIVTWDYIVSLVRMLEDCGMDDKIKRPLVVQELSNTCHQEYRRAQSTFRRQISRGVAIKCFRRVTTNGISKIAIKGQPSDYTVSDPQLHYVLRLCHPVTKHTDAAQWLHAHLVDFSVEDRWVEEARALFTGRTTELDDELAQYKAEADFGDHLVPVDNLLESGVAGNALKALDEFMLKQAGMSLGSLYEDLLHDRLNDVEKKCSDAKTRVEQQQPYVPLPMTAEEPKLASSRAQQRREKAKTRPADEARAYDITAIPPPQLEVTAMPAPRLKVKASTASVFDTIFSRDKARGSVSWVDFAGAMGDLGFSVTPKYGSVFKFHPPEAIEATRSITLHRPHASEIEGYKLLIFSRTLQRTYNWTAETFEVE